MRKTLGMNKHQKAVYKKGEVRVGKEQVAELLELAGSDNVEDRLTAAEFLCPCHVRTRIPVVWDALYRLMADADPRVRQQAWHTIEDGGKPSDAESAATLERLCKAEADPKIRKFAEITLDKVLGKRGEKELTEMWLAGRAPVKQRGKCDFCGDTDAFVTRDLQTMIPSGSQSRAALMCERCAQAE